MVEEIVRTPKAAWVITAVAIILLIIIAAALAGCGTLPVKPDVPARADSLADALQGEAKALTVAKPADAAALMAGLAFRLQGYEKQARQIAASAIAAEKEAARLAAEWAEKEAAYKKELEEADSAARRTWYLIVAILGGVGIVALGLGVYAKAADLIFGGAAMAATCSAFIFFGKIIALIVGGVIAAVAIVAGIFWIKKLAAENKLKAKALAITAEGVEKLKAVVPAEKAEPIFATLKSVNEAAGTQAVLDTARGITR